MSVNRLPDHDWTHEFEHGGPHSLSWIGLIVLLSLGIICNVTVYCLMLFSSKLKQSSASFILRILSLQGTLFSLSCILQCAFSMSIDSFAGGFTACEIQATLHCFFVLFSGCTLCCMAFNAERKISNKQSLSNKEIIWFHIISGAVTLFISCVSVLVAGGPRITPGALYCFVSLDELAGGLVFFGSCVSLIFFLSHRYWRIFQVIDAHSVAVTHVYRSNSATLHKQQMRSMQKMLLFVFTYALCALPILVITIYERISGHDAPPASYIAAVYVVHANSMINCMLYVGMNSYLRNSMLEMLGLRKPMSEPSQRGVSTVAPTTPTGRTRITMSGRIARHKREMDSTRKSIVQKSKIMSTDYTQPMVPPSPSTSQHSANTTLSCPTPSHHRSVAKNRVRLLTSISNAKSLGPPSPFYAHPALTINMSPSASMYASPPGFVDDSPSAGSRHDSPLARPKITMKWLGHPSGSIELIRNPQSPKSSASTLALKQPAVLATSLAYCPPQNL